jgi:glycosyltransferase involved in cell wall biosynthesis
MRILYVVTSLEVGGIERNLIRLARELIGRGHKITVVSSGGELVRELEEAGGKHVRAQVTWRSPGGLIGAAFRIRTLISSDSVDVVHAMSAAASVATYFARRASRSWSYITSPMGLEGSDREPRTVTWLRNAVIVAGADRVLAESPAIHLAIQQAGAVDSKIVECDLVGLEDRFFEPVRQLRALERSRMGLTEDEPVITTIGALHPRKRHDLFIAMAAEVAATFPRARFLIVGEGTDRGTLERLAEDSLPGKIRFLGQMADVRPVLAATDVYVKPGVVEGFIGITVLEAMATSRPVVAFDTSDVRMVIEDGVTGSLASRGDDRALAAQVSALLADRQMSSHIAANGHTVVERRFRIGRVVDRLEEIYGDRK